MTKQTRKKAASTPGDMQTASNGMLATIFRGLAIALSAKWAPWTVVGVIAFALAAALLVVVLRPSTSSSLAMGLIAVLIVFLVGGVLFLIWYRSSTRTKYTPPLEPPSSATLVPPDGEREETAGREAAAAIGSAIRFPLNAEWFKSDLAKKAARDFNASCGHEPARRFFGEMMVHRLRSHDTTPHADGYTVTRHAEDLPEAIRNNPLALRRKMLEVMREDYEAIFHAATSAVGASSAERPRFDTTIFRDLELWARGTYWASNRALAGATQMRRLFLYEDGMFEPDEDGVMTMQHREELLGLFTGIMIHNYEKWRYNVLNIVDLRNDEMRADLLGAEWASKETQSSAVFDGHTVVFIGLTRDSTTLVHRFYNDRPGFGLGKVASFTQAFKEAFMLRGRPAAPDALKEHLCGLHKKIEAQIGKIYNSAMQKLTAYEQQYPKAG